MRIKKGVIMSRKARKSFNKWLRVLEKNAQKPKRRTK